MYKSTEIFVPVKVDTAVRSLSFHPPHKSLSPPSSVALFCWLSDRHSSSISSHGWENRKSHRKWPSGPVVLKRGPAVVDVMIKLYYRWCQSSLDHTPFPPSQFQRLHPLVPLMKVLPSIFGPRPHRIPSPSPWLLKIQTGQPNSLSVCLSVSLSLCLCCTCLSAQNV